MRLELGNTFKYDSNPAREIHLKVTKHEADGTQIGTEKTIRYEDDDFPYDIESSQYLKVLLAPQKPKPDSGPYRIYVNYPVYEFLKTKKITSVRKKLELIISIEEGEPKKTTYRFEENKVKVIICYSADKQPSENVRIGDGNQ